MANLYEILADAQNGESMNELGRQFGLSPHQTQAAVAALRCHIDGAQACDCHA